MSIFTSNLRPSLYNASALLHQHQQPNNFKLYSIPSSDLLLSFTETVSEIASFRGTLRNIFDGGCEVDWDTFKEWLKRRGLSRKHRVDVLSKARKYWAVLLLGDFKLFRDAVNKRHVLAALSNLARFLGVYGKWRMMLMQNDVSWSDGKNNSEWVFR